MANLLMTAGACFAEPEEGELRLVTAKLKHYLGSGCNVEALGLMVQEYGPRYSDDGFALCGGGQWEDVCPLVDFPQLHPLSVEYLPNLRY